LAEVYGADYASAIFRQRQELKMKNVLWINGKWLKRKETGLSERWLGEN